MNKKLKITLEILLHCFVGVFCLCLMVFLEGIPPSISEFTGHITTSVIFKSWMLFLAYGATRNKQLRHTIYPIIGMVVFDVSEHDNLMNLLHNIFAISFYLMVTISFLWKKYSRTIGILMVLSSISLLFSIFWGEVILITLLYLYFFEKILRLNNIKLFG